LSDVALQPLAQSLTSAVLEKFCYVGENDYIKMLMLFHCNIRRQSVKLVLEIAQSGFLILLLRSIVAR
jgi:hypothetical protein